MPPRVLAVDWSGSKQWARRKIWLAEVVEGEVLRLETGRGRSEIIQHLISEAQEDPNLVVGLDFAFSFPVWFLDEHGAEEPREIWGLAGSTGEKWLEACEPPFWGRTGRRRPDVPSHFRRTELQVQSIAGTQPKSVFQVGGAGAVGTGSLRGMPYLSQLADAGFSVWPFHPPGWPLVLEIYPRVLTGALIKSDPLARVSYLHGSFPELTGTLRSVAASSEDALDTAVSAIVMARHLEEIEALEVPEDPVARREGVIWYPAAAADGGAKPGATASSSASSAAPSDDTATGSGAASPSGSPADASARSSPDASAGSSTEASAESSTDASTESSDEPDCGFCEFEEGQTVAESEHAVAVLDAFPVSEGHVLVIPRQHAESIFDLPVYIQQDLWRLVDRVRADLTHVLGVESFNVGINDGEEAGQTIPHAHIHVISRRSGDVDDPRGGIRWVLPDKAAYWDR